MSKKYNKTITREIRKSFGRFAAIIAIVALGVGFLVGILSSTPDMKATADKYYTDYAMSDFDLKSTLGFTDDDVSAIMDIPEVATVMPANVMDALVLINNDHQITGRIHGMDLKNQTVNKLQLIEGRMPENKKECVIEKPTTYLEDISVGDTITISKENEDVKDTYTQTKFKVTGIVDNPYYFCTSKEPSSVGAGRTGVIMYTYRSAFEADVYTDLFIRTDTELSGFSDEYETFIASVTDKIEAVSDERIPARHKEVVDEAMSEVNDAKDTLNKERSRVNAELADAERELANGQKEYNDGLSQLKDAKEQVASGRKQIADGRRQVADGKKQLEANKAYMDPAVYTAQLAQLNATEKQLDTKEAQLDTAAAEVKRNEAKLADAAAELSKGRAELADGRAEAADEFANAEAEIADAEKGIADIKEPEWYILDRDSNLSYAKYSVDVEKVASIATVFPIFFFLVAALVSLTTMTRMVEEERIQIGTLKAIGYRRSKIMSKYLIYCGVATVIGCVIGLLAGFQVLPSLIFMAFESQYDLPDLILQMNVKYAILSCGLEIICTLGATWMACYQTLREKPSHLMVPRAPKAGKRILLERIGFIWEKLSFTYKATARNVFRYKKHMMMTIVGIAGCTALIVAGLGIQDSLTALVKTQFDDILKYDMRIDLTEEKSDKTLDSFLEDKDALYLMSSSFDIESEKNNELISSTMYVPKNPDDLKDFVNLRESKSEEDVAFDIDSVVISEKMAEVLEAAPGDTIKATNSDGVHGEFVLTGITENYAGCYVYVAPAQYSKEFRSPEYNCWLLDSGIEGQKAQDEITSRLQKSEYVSTVEFTSQSQEGYQIVLDSLTFLVYVLVMFAGLLAVVVLYNLTNININERIRELATLRVLGYHHKEVALYIFREIGILTIMGTAAGLILGKILHYYIVLVAESPDMVFGRQLDVSTYVLAAVITIAFSILVDALMLIKLKRIDMAASMKAVD